MEEADSAFAAMGPLLQNDDDIPGGAQDVACNVSFSRNGGVGGFTAGDGNVNSSTEYSAVAGSVGFVKVVTTITWCGTTGSYTGCTNVGARNGIVVTRAASIATARGNTWAHEFGHSVGLGHVSTSSRIMWGTASSLKNQVTSSECSAFRDNNLDEDGPGGNPAPENPGRRQAPPDESSPTLLARLAVVPIEDFARNTILDTMPFEAADHYGPADVAVLRAMLLDPREAEHHATIAALIGIISSGADVDAQALLALARSKDRDPTVTAAAFIALGYLGNRGNRNAVDFLADETNKTDSTRADWALQGLGVSGHPNAALTLRRLKLDVDRPGIKARAFGRSSVMVNQALEEHESVKVRGLRDFYRR